MHFTLKTALLATAFLAVMFWGLASPSIMVLLLFRSVAYALATASLLAAIAYSGERRAIALSFGVSTWAALHFLSSQLRDFMHYAIQSWGVSNTVAFEHRLLVALVCTSLALGVAGSLFTLWLYRKEKESESPARQLPTGQG